ncbi:MAG: helix-turn-helix transcriptional regulator [Acidimicrobiia bacterium]
MDDVAGPDDHLEAPVYVISVAAELAGMHPQTLRMYERRGLVTPGRTSGNTRRYSRRDIERLRQIQDLTRHHGMNLAGVAMVIRLEADLGRARSRIAALEDELVSLQQDAAAALDAVHRTYRRDLVPYDPPPQIVRAPRRRGG